MPRIETRLAEHEPMVHSVNEDSIEIVVALYNPVGLG